MHRLLSSGKRHTTLCFAHLLETLYIAFYKISNEQIKILKNFYTDIYHDIYTDIKKVLSLLIALLYYWFLPQQFLYFLPLPHVQSLSVYMLHIVYIVLLVFQAFQVLGTFNTYSIYSTYSIISIYLLRTICEHCSQYFILLLV